jgi:hypothetical protein
VPWLNGEAGVELLKPAERLLAAVGGVKARE